MLRTALALALATTLPVSWAGEAATSAASSRGNYQSARESVAAESAARAAGKTAEPRQARYQSGPALHHADKAGATTESSALITGVAHRDPQLVAAAETAAKTPEPARPADVELRRSATHDFRLYDAGRSLLTDADADGYYRRFEIRFDADVSFGDAEVYAKLYLRRVGDTGPWEHYYTTDDFWIHGESDTDDYYVETVLNDGYATAEYDVLIDLYESGYSGIVATIGPFDDGSLRDLPLEDSGLDMPVPNAGYQIGDVDTTLITDSDRDGYYSRFSISFDPDRDVGSSLAYAVLRVRRDGGDWETEHTSDTFLVDASGDADRFSFDGDWLSGYPTARYDIQIDLYDAVTQLLVATVSSERPELSRVPLEDAGRDQVPNGGGGGGGGGDSDSDGSGGGSMSVVLLGLAAGLLYARWRLNRDRMLRQVRIKTGLH